MKLLIKINAVMLVVFLAVLALAYQVAHGILMNNARSEIQDNARIMMASAIAVRTYTKQHIQPLLGTQLRYGFLPEFVPSFSATVYFNNLRKKFPDYAYREAALNPTNPSDRAVDWEVDVLNHFRENATATELIRERDTAVGKFMYFAMPMRMPDSSCLQCHSSVSAAPPTMLAKYGTANGFGWQMNDVIAAQIVSVPSELPLKRANAVLRGIVLLLVGLFVLLFVAINGSLYLLVVRPVTRLASIADHVSRGDQDAPHFPSEQRDEIGELGASFNRMRVTVKKAMEALHRAKPGGQ
jgi:protein-histidine pros-kinase